MSSSKWIVTSDCKELYFKVSCRQCKLAHRSCDRRLPTCTRCNSKNLTCCYEEPKKRSRNNANTTSKQQAAKRCKMNDESAPVVGFQDCEFNVAEWTNASLSKLSRAHISSICKTTCSVIPRGMSAPQMDEVFDMRVATAMWCATRAYTLVHLPNNDESFLDVMEARFQQFNKRDDFINELVSDLRQLRPIISQTQVNELAEHMYLKAKAIILHPDVYPLVGQSPVLANVCAVNGLYLISKHGAPNETKLLNSAVKVCIDNNSGLTDLDLSSFSIVDKERLAKQKDSIFQVLFSFYKSKMLLFVNEDAERHNVKKFHKMMKSMVRFCHLASKKYDRETIAFPAAQFTKWLQLFDEEFGVAGLQQFLAYGDMIEQQLSSLIPTREEVNPMIVTINCIQLFAAQLYSKLLKHSPQATSAVNRLKLVYANKMSKGFIEFSDAYIYSAPALAGAFDRIFEVHAEYSFDILSKPNASVMDLSELLSILQRDMLYLNKVIDRYGIDLRNFHYYQKKIQRLIASVTDAMQAQYNNSQFSIEPREIDATEDIFLNIDEIDDDLFSIPDLFDLPETRYMEEE